ncbi:tetrahydromethanopterin S-methyltransferase subunit G [Marmoricola sp. URHA0025 HA25]
MAEYDVVLLVEQALTAQDAQQVRGLHEEIDEPVTYHLLVPVEDSATQIESGMGALAGGEVLATPTMFMDPDDIEEIRHEVLDEARAAVRDSVANLEAAGGKAVGDVVSVDPIQALAKKVADVDAREAIILTRPHVVSEFFHLDWTSRARRKLGVPVLHLLEHETFDEQAGEGEGISGF